MKNQCLILQHFITHFSLSRIVYFQVSTPFPLLLIWNYMNVFLIITKFLRNSISWVTMRIRFVKYQLIVKDQCWALYQITCVVEIRTLAKREIILWSNKVRFKLINLWCKFVANLLEPMIMQILYKQEKMFTWCPTFLKKQQKKIIRFQMNTILICEDPDHL